MGAPLRVLIVEDSEEDTLLIVRELKRGGFDPIHERVETAEAMKTALSKKTWDLILADYSMPHFSGLEALKLSKESGLDLPFFIVSGTIGEDVAVGAMKSGAHDYLMKNNLARLVPAIQQELREAEVRQKLKESEKAFQEAQRSLGAVVETAPSLIVLTDPDGRIVLFNRTCEELTGYKREEVIGKTIPELFLPPEWILVVQKRFANPYAPEVRAPHENPWLTKSGEERLIEWRCTVLPSPQDGRPCILGTGVDITERKQAEETLKASEEKFRELYDNAPVGYHEMNKRGIITRVNHSDLEMLGYSVEEMVGQPIWNFIAEEENVREVFFAKVFGKIPPGKAYERRYVRKDGTTLITLAEDRLLMNEKGEITDIRVTIQDITDRKQAEEALRRSEERFRQLYDNAPVGYFEYDTQGLITSVNRTELEMLGYTLDEMIGQSVWKFIVEEEETRQQILAKLAGTMPPARGLERNYKKKDGHVLPVSIEDRILRDPQGRITGIRCTIQDITDRKKAEEALRSSEEKYRTILENIEDGYFEVDIAGNFTFFNDSLCRLLGYSRDEMIGMNNRQYTDQENAKKLFQAFNKVYRTGEPAREFDWEIIRKDGTKRSIEASVSLIKDPSGNRIGFRGIVRDITERKRAEAEKASLQDQLRQSQKIEAIGRLAGGIAHDFNNLLTVIKGYSQLSLIELKEDVPLRGNIEEIKRASDKAADLTRQLLAFSRRQILEMRVLDLNTALRDMDKMLHRLIGEDIELVTVFTDDLGRVKTDPGWVEQIIMNLAVNARDAMPSVGKLTIETANVELDGAYARNHIAVTPGRYVMLSVSDTGVGMTPEVRQQVFEPFFTTKEKGKGTGLGLSTVYGIVKQSGGNIWVYSEPGQGTTFKIYLPRVDEPLEELKEKVVKEELPHGSETILLVEDEEVVRKLAVRILKRQGYTVLEGSHGNEAIDVCKQHKGPVHLLLTDVVMPHMSGRQLAEQLKQVCQDFKVLYMSGYTDNAITHHGVLEEGINYLQKPFTVDGLARKVREVLDK